MINDKNCFSWQKSAENPNPLAKAELNLLAHLVGGSSKKPESKFKKNHAVSLPLSNVVIQFDSFGQVYELLTLGGRGFSH